VNLLKAPVRLVHFPGVAVAVVAAALILALTATTGRLFLATAGDAAVAQELDRIGGVPILAMVMFGNRPADVAAVQEAAEMEATAGARSTGVRLAARDGFEAHIRALERAGGDGAWLPDGAARSLGVRAGQTVRLGQPPGVRLRVAGVYRDLSAGGHPLDPFWSPLTSAIYSQGGDKGRAAAAGPGRPGPVPRPHRPAGGPGPAGVELPLWLAGRLDGGRAGAAELLERLGLARLSDRLPAEVSLGERQRVALARAMVVHPRLLLADEPTGHQDADWAVAVFDALAALGSCCMVATHSDELLARVDRVLTISDGQLPAGQGVSGRPRPRP
jgi:hypothetical protein